ncbi:MULTISPECIES: ABC transporter substrate-binding protein [Aerococcus]|uniref:SsuA/THI5-like domain-containing protein n=1 Tax=Aerococcus sanguinicola TaxID=119206 RepID=A0A5N1GNX1_9LACT|nr:MULTISPECIES: ABC transporter substrate-binding protein [Aerococcus]KAA9301959.1 hypothetical protein F6I03_01765 [Aerococcus sanguinicola]MDK6368616.1 ABC transporter substrate-binding protein [Aerococcus sp. UMB9870]MDK6686029.1 ABC transporter substrate-binding protein [Aerococcus sp. UMB8623]MDK6940835.1 ABC transporter substrate-binding protein [Aerococcus sp. UMB8487]OFK21322.1 hypothetical protein HMPREF2829_03370 [Aerococcus sp. HMSC072A12]
MKRSIKQWLTLGLCGLALVGCQTSVNESQSAGQETNETSQTTASKQEGQAGSAEAGGGTEAVALEQVNVDDDDAWKKEPAYGQTIKVINSTGCTAPVNVAELKGYFDDEGLDVEVVKSQQTTIDAVGTGQVALGAGLITPTLIPIINGVNAQYLGPMHTGCKGLYVAADSEAESSADLADSKIGIHGGLGESDHNVGLRFFLKSGVDTDSIDWVSTDSSASPQAIANGELDGAIYDENVADPFVKNGTLKELDSTTETPEFKDEVCCAYYINKDFARENPITAKRLARALYKANAWAEEDSDAYINYLFEENLLTGDKDISYDFIDSLDYHPSQDQMSETVKEIVADYQELGIVDQSLNPDDLYRQLYAPVGFNIEDFVGQD